MVIFVPGCGHPSRALRCRTSRRRLSLADVLEFTFPLLSPTTFFLVVTSVISALKAFDVVAIMTYGRPLNSTNVYVLYLYQNAFDWFRTGYASALALVLFAVILAITLGQMRLSKRWVHY